MALVVLLNKPRKRKIKRNESSELEKLAGIGLKGNPGRKRKKRHAKKSTRKRVRKLKTTFTGGSAMAKKRGRKAKSRKASRRPRKVSRRTTRSRRPKRKQITRRARKAVKVTVKINSPKRSRRRVIMPRPLGSGFSPVLRNDWPGHIPGHRVAAKAGWYNRAIGISGKKAWAGSRMVGGKRRFPVNPNPLNRPMFRSPLLPVPVKHRRKGGHRSVSVWRNPGKALSGGVKGFIAPITAKETWIDVGGITLGTVFNPIIIRFANKMLGGKIPTTGFLGIIVELGTGVLGSTAVAMFLGEKWGKNYLYGTAAGVADNLVKTFVLPKLPFLAPAAPKEPVAEQPTQQDYLTVPPQANVSDYLTTATRTDLNPNLGEYAHAADDNKSEF